MTIPLNKVNVNRALEKMVKFHADLKKLYENNDLNLLDNIGRRNILMSEPMERFLAESLIEDGHVVTSDGRPGEPDIYVKNLHLEIECKLTSRNSNGSINFQTDYETLKKKGKLDYVYIIADQEFEKFCVLYFKGLTVNDFRKLSNGARGKVAMYKWKGMKKCTVLRGDAVNITSDNKKKEYNESLKKYTKNLILKGRMIETLNIPDDEKKSIYDSWKTKQITVVNKLKESYQNSLQKKSRWKFIFK